MNHIRYLRVTQGLTQLQLRMATGIEQSLLSSYENGIFIPTTPNLLSLSEFYKTNLDYLMDLTDEKQLYPKKTRLRSGERWINNIRYIRVTRELGQQALADASGIAQPSLSKYERGATMPTVKNLMKLATFYHTSLDYLMDLTDDPTPYPRKG